MTERFLNTKCESPAALIAETFALPNTIRQMVNVTKSNEVGYPVIYISIACGELSVDILLDAALVNYAAKSDEAIQKFILTEIQAFSESFVMELVSHKHQEMTPA